MMLLAMQLALDAGNHFLRKRPLVDIMLQHGRNDCTETLWKHAITHAVPLGEAVAAVENRQLQDTVFARLEWRPPESQTKQRASQAPDIYTLIDTTRVLHRG